MRITGPQKSKKQLAAPLLRAQIEEAQRNTKSNMAAARYLDVSYVTYKRYATIYGLFDQHLNQRGVGIPKEAVGRRGIPISKIFNNEYPKYSLTKLKKRMLIRDLLVEECSLCGFSEKRITDGKIPLLLTFKDGKRNYNKSNLILLCYNCMFLTTGLPVVSHRLHMEKSVTEMAEGNTPDNLFYEDGKEYKATEYDYEDFERDEVADEIDIDELRREALEELDDE